jgi:putative transposase
VRERIGLVEKNHPQLSRRRQCDLLSVARSSVDYERVAESAEDLRAKRVLDETYLSDPCLGSRRLVTILERDHGLALNRKHVQRLRRELGQEAIFCRPRTTVPDHAHRKYPYLLRQLTIARPDEVWCADITYIPMPGGSAYLCAVMDWYSRKVLGWAVSNTMDTSLCLAALNEALRSTGKIPDIFNTDQGSQFTSEPWTCRLLALGIQISMDGRGRWMDNVFIERLWRSVKYEEIYLREHATLPVLEAGLKRWFARYNTWRPHEALGNRTPHEVYQMAPPPETALCELAPAKAA